MFIRIYFDGACEPTNPGGNIGYGYIAKLFNGGNIKVISKGSFYRPAKEENTNNMAEYAALYKALHYLLLTGQENHRIEVYGDSKLVINQMRGAWKAYAGKGYFNAYLHTKELASKFTNISYHWIPRDGNSEADELSKMALKNRNINFNKYQKQ